MGPSRKGARLGTVPRGRGRGGADDHEAGLHHDCDPVCQRPATPWLCAGAGAGRRTPPGTAWLRGDEVRLLTGTDDNSLKNVLAAEAAGLTTAELVARNATHFANLHVSLQLAFDDFIRTSTDPRHQPAVARLWRACAAAGDLYREWYEGLYCVGCEQFYAAEEFDRGRCPEHETVPERVAEENWFFRLTRYQDQLEALITSGRLRILPEFHAREVLAFVRGGLQDFSISRSREGPRLGHRGTGRPRPRDLRLVGCAGQLHQ